VFDVPARVFVPAMSVGALLYITVYTLLGFFLGQPVLDLLEQVHLPFGLFGSLIPLGLLVWWTLRARQELARRVVPTAGSEREQRFRAGAIAGGLATIGSTLALNVLINLAGNIAFTAPDTILERTAARLAFSAAREVEPGWFFVAVPVYLGVGVLWGAGYALWGEERLGNLTDWQKGVLFAMLPFLISLVFAMPLLGLGYFGVGATGPVAAVGELGRHVTYGLLLGLIYPVLRYRRQVRVIPHAETELAADQPITA
ncbi:MAG: hypothetical protein JOY61_16955, partial [Chloroflexi bacterium]|nr:hypothetical protein [Chloroflexota bacterium]